MKYLRKIYPLFYIDHIHTSEYYKLMREMQRMFNPNIKEVFKNEVCSILPIFISEWVSLVEVMPKKLGLIIVKNEREGGFAYVHSKKMVSLYQLPQIK